ncbi:hypothetical protein HYPSUDRAFT_60136 [Hypholoma sublateritium FD-334 SS-4]|uniref:Uncharacterized protein n=1 Tax=Hypholoma sublateritium (strain FD-334 SS-4) TaxID=945553 RepID=A0A0D2LQ93_HYPSF|nr:hypothetical protein HYPSUDRAFT_60136 [Hypholoma sublateritium FD-334 SS-4]
MPAATRSTKSAPAREIQPVSPMKTRRKRQASNAADVANKRHRVDDEGEEEEEEEEEEEPPFPPVKRKGGKVNKIPQPQPKKIPQAKAKKPAAARRTSAMKDTDVKAAAAPVKLTPSAQYLKDSKIGKAPPPRMLVVPGLSIIADTSAAISRTRERSEEKIESEEEQEDEAETEDQSKGSEEAERLSDAESSGEKEFSSPSPTPPPIIGKGKQREVVQHDVEMDSSDLQGASRITGGVFRGKALGNAPNAADIAHAGTEEDWLPTLGSVFIFLAMNGPQNAPSPDDQPESFKVKVNFTLRSKVLCDNLVEHQTIQSGMMFYFFEEGSWSQRGVVGLEPFDDTDIPWVFQGYNASVSMLISPPALFPAISSNRSEPSTRVSSASRDNSVAPSTGSAKQKLSEAELDKVRALFIELQADQQLSRYLNITNARDFTIFDYFVHWKAINKAWSAYQTHKNDPKWKMDFGKFQKNDIVEHFLSKSHFHQQVNKPFEAVFKTTTFAAMAQWLESNGTKPPSAEVWGITQDTYTLVDLQTWVKNGGSMNLKQKVSHKKKTGSHK